MQPDLTRDEDLKSVLEGLHPFERNATWLNNLTEFLAFVRDADLETRKPLAFQRKLWEDNAASSVGMGTV